MANIGYKLFKVRKDGSIGPLFINARQRIPVGEWLPAGDHKTKGFAHRPGWHLCKKPVAPHLKMLDNRRWFIVEYSDAETYSRPESQGGEWILAQHMRVICSLDQWNMTGE